MTDAPPHVERSEHPLRQPITIAAVALLAVPAVVLRLTDAHMSQPWMGAVIYGMAVVSAAFILAWSAEAAQLDISQGLALAVLALIAVLPEYAVDFVFASKGGNAYEEFGRQCQSTADALRGAESPCSLALANMTGANRLLIGVGWSMVVLLGAWRLKKRAQARGERLEHTPEVVLERSHSVEIGFLAVATAYSLTLPLKSSLILIDSAVLITIFIWYVIRIARAPAEEPHLVGPAQWIGNLPTGRRRLVTVGMLVVAAAVILASAERFAEGLVETGEEFGISEFLLVQWLAPLASEAPELLVAGMFAWRLNTNAGLGTLVSSKVNQWTLLVGSLPIVFAVASSSTHGLPLDSLQREELFLTAAQSAFAVAILANRSIGVREALTLFGLFVAQFILGAILPEDLREWERIGVGIVYLVLAAAVIVKDRRRVPNVIRDGFRTPMSVLAEGDDLTPEAAA